MTHNTKEYHLLYNHQGSLRAVVDTEGTIIKELHYDSFGTITKDTNPTLHVTLGFAGGLYDKDTKLTRFGYRDYDAYTGKWTAKDPIGFSGGDANLYGYVLGDPVNLVDPSGLILPATVIAVIPYVAPVALSAARWAALQAARWAARQAAIWAAEKAREQTSNEEERETKKEQSCQTKKKSKSSAKARATDIPSWAKGTKPRSGQSPNDYAKEQMNNRYQPGNWERRGQQGREYSQLKKWGQRGDK